MTAQIYWDEINVGDEIKPLPKVATTQMLVKWAGASGDFNPLHYDDVFAAMQGVGKRIIHGELKRAWLVQFAVNWAGEQGILRKISCQYRALDYPRPMMTPTIPLDGETWWCKGKVTNKYTKDREHLVECDVWIENGRGEVTTPGKATVALPMKG